MSWVTDEMTIGDKIYTLDKRCEKIIEWEIININHFNKRFFIVINKEYGVKQIMRSFIQYGSLEHNHPSISKEILIERYRKSFEYKLKELDNLIK